MIATTGEEEIVGTPTTEYENNASATCRGLYFVLRAVFHKRKGSRKKKFFSKYLTKILLWYIIRATKFFMEELLL